ncbi:putative polysaccharide biosynthesis protein [Streptococcus porci]|uniref:putative polysaccharide biosynthesis protein n=1 Tax=Streptococcus porci TaxID=502567 RepID=UPI000411FF37|nr:polysaccharide biosynthesis protein [Streptococcus porci]
MSDTKRSKVDQQQSKMVRGMAWLTAGNFISRLIGVIYVIPWIAWLGVHADEANGLFGMGYNIYSIFLSISTVGIPVAVAKQIAKYNAVGKGEIGYYLVREFLKVMLAIGAFFAGIMYFAAPLLARLSGYEADLIPVMRSLSWAVLFFPMMSVIRGVFQGTNNLRPYATSQVVEQILRVIWILMATFYIMKFGSGDYKEAVVQSTFAAFIGMLGSLAVLIFSLNREGILLQIFRARPSEEKADTLSLIVETTKEAIPFIIVGSAFQVYQLIDQVTFANTMSLFSSATKEELLTLYAYMTSNPNKITMIIIGVTGSIGSVAIPLITENFVKKDRKSTASLILNNLQMLLIFLVPAVFGSIILARPLYTIFYPNPKDLAIQLFIINLLQIFVMGFYALFGPVIQALFENRRAMLYFVYGLIVKLLLQIPLIWLFGVYGPLIATTVGLSVSTYLMYKRVHDMTHFNRMVFAKNTLLILLMTAVMAVVVGIVELGLVRVMPATGKLSSLIHLAVGGGLGVLVYGYLALWTRQSDKLIGVQRSDSFRRKLRIKAKG